MVGPTVVGLFQPIVFRLKRERLRLALSISTTPTSWTSTKTNGRFRRSLFLCEVQGWRSPSPVDSFGKQIIGKNIWYITVPEGSDHLMWSFLVFTSPLSFFFSLSTVWTRETPICSKRNVSECFRPYQTIYKSMSDVSFYTDFHQKIWKKQKNIEKSEKIMWTWFK